MKADDAVEGALAVLVQLALIICLGAIAVWAWPSKPLSLLGFSWVLWALFSLVIWIVALGWFWSLVEPLLKRDAGDAL
jgi:hypothetical protein